MLIKENNTFNCDIKITHTQRHFVLIFVTEIALETFFLNYLMDIRGLMTFYNSIITLQCVHVDISKLWGYSADILFESSAGFILVVYNV